MKIICSQSFNKLARIDDIKDMRGRSSVYRTDETPLSENSKKLDEGVSGKTDIERGQELDDIWRNAFYNEKDKEKQKKRELEFSF